MGGLYQPVGHGLSVLGGKVTILSCLDEGVPAVAGFDFLCSFSMSIVSVLFPAIAFC